MSDDKKPSLDDFTDNTEELPSVDEFISEEVVEELPSVEQYIVDVDKEVEYEKQDLPSINEEVVDESLPSVESYIEKEEEEIEEEVQTLEDANGETFAEVKDIVPPWPELLRLVDEVRESIPDIPEIKYYDDDLEKISQTIEELRSEIPVVPEVKYYDEEVNSLDNKFSDLKEFVSSIPNYDVDDKLNHIQDKFNEDIQKLSEDIEVKDFESRVDVDALKTSLKETTENIYEELKKSSDKINEHKLHLKDDDRKLKKQILGQFNLLKENISKKVEEFNNKNIESQNVITGSLKEYFDELQDKINNLPEIKYYDKEIDQFQIDIKELREIVDQLKETQKQDLQENLLTEPPDTDNEDPLTPLDQKYVTFEKLQEHYRVFVNRVQQQLSSFSGGGETKLQYLDDIVGIATNISAYDGKFLKIDVSQSAGKNFIFEEVDIPQVGAAGTWEVGSVGIHTLKKVGIGTTARSNYQLYVKGDVYATGNISAAGTITYEDVTNVDSIGIITGRKDLQINRNATILGVTTIGSANVGSSGTTLLVKGNTRITGILTVGESSITIDGDNETVSVGIVTITNATVNIGDNVTINSSATGINSAPNVFYVAKDGDDSNNGTSIDNAKLTIAGAVGIATSGSTVKVLSGTYVESNPIQVPANVSIVGDDQRSVNVIGSTAEKDIFSVRKGVKLANMTFQNHIAPAAAVGFPTTEIAENIGGGKWKGPYVQNCTSDTTSGVGIRIDGSQARLLKSMNVDAFTQYNQGGIGVAVTNGGFAQLVSLFTICCDEAVTCDKGGQADIANSNCSFGTYGLVSRGVGSLQFTGLVTSTAAVSQDEVVLNINTPTRTISGVAYTNTTGQATVTTTAAHGFEVGMGVTLAGIGFTCEYGSKIYPHKKPFVFEVDAVPTTTTFQVNLGISTLSHTYVGSGSSAGTAAIDIDRPYDGQQCYFNTLFETINTITVGSGGTGYTSTPSVTIDAPSGPNGETATAFATLDGESVSSITIINAGSQYTETPDITIGAPNVGVNTATATASMSPIYYAINSSTPVVSGVTTVTLGTNLLNAVGVGSTAYFYQQSKIIASSHTFEYVGSGNTITLATPKRGGVTIQANEVVTSDGGKVIYTSTDQAGNFRIGDDLQINQETGTISGRAFSRSLFTEMTPFILALS
jgi:hypothetical protein